MFLSPFAEGVCILYILLNRLSSYDQANIDVQIMFWGWGDPRGRPGQGDRGEGQQKAPSEDGAFTIRCYSRRLDVAHDVGENVADGRPEQGQNDDHDDGNQNKNQRIFNQTLTFLAWQKQHCFHPPSILDF